MQKPQKLRRTKPNRGIELKYRREMKAIIQEMRADVEKEILSLYASMLPQIAQDKAEETLTASIRDRMIARFKNQRMKWYSESKERSRGLPQWFVDAVERRSRQDLQKKLKEAGITVKMKITPQIEAKLKEAAKENAGLIKSIPQEYLQRIQRATLESLKKGRDLAGLKKDILGIGKSTERRAALIARDQLDTLTQNFANIEARSVGATKGRWIHIPGVYSSRKTHKAFDGKIFDLDKGLYDADVGKEVLPGELINCGCSFEVILPGLG